MTLGVGSDQRSAANCEIRFSQPIRQSEDASVNILLPSYLLSIHPACLLPRYGNSHTRYVDRRDAVKLDPIGQQ